ncbi:MAG: ABC transporter ATP-binding protein [Brevinemataceae bacterium]
MSFISFDNIQKFYGDVQVLHNLSLSIEKGEFIVFLGPSGSGKSTFLRVLAGLEEISGGKIILDGKDITVQAPYKRKISMVFQNYALYPHMSVKDNICYGLKNRKIPKEEIEIRLNRVSEMLEISHLLLRKPTELSGGQRQRVAMGRAIVQQPKVFLFDEPLSNLDAKLRVKMRMEIKKLQKELGITTVYVTHDQVEAMTMGDKILLMNEGRISQFDTPDKLYHSPSCLFTAGFIGSPSMNFFQAECTGNHLRTVDNLLEFELAECDALNNIPLILGIRSEHMFMTKKNNEKHLSLTVNMIENLGSYFYAYGEMPSSNDPVSVKAGSRDKEQLSIGGKIELFIDPSYVHIFNAQTGMRLGIVKEFLGS